MKEFVLTKSYRDLQEMINSSEMCAAKEELQQGVLKEYAVVSRIGNRYDIDGKRIEGFVVNPFYKEEKKVEVKDMKYERIEALIDTEIKTAVEQSEVNHSQEIAQIKADYEKKIVELKEMYAAEVVNAKEKAKAELIEKLNG